MSCLAGGFASTAERGDVRNNTVSPPDRLHAHIYSKHRTVLVLIKSKLIKSLALQRRGINQMKTFISIQNFMIL